MRLRLKYQPTEETAHRFAADMIVPTRQISGATLDYSIESLVRVDDIIERMRRDGRTSDQIGETLFGFGCYVGEVFVHNAGGTWRKTTETLMASYVAFPLVVELSGSRFCNPIGKVFKRLENGDEDSLPYFYQVFGIEK